MPETRLVTRESLRRELLVNAATKPLALAVAAAVAVAAFLIGALWLLAVAAALYIALAVATFFDDDEAERVGRATYERARLPRGERELPRGLAPEIASLVERARVEERRILQAIAASDFALTDVSVEVDSLTAEMERIAGRAQTIWTYLSQQHPFDVQRRLRDLEGDSGGATETARARERAAEALRDQLRVVESLQAELQRFRAEMEHLIASLGVVHGQLVRLSVAREAGVQEDVAGQVRDLRERVGSVSEAMRDTVARLPDD
jgi:chromosome segregation ATPase